MDEFGAIILAAGKSTRFGMVKQFASLANKPLYMHSIELALRTNLTPILLIGNERTERMRDEVGRLNITYLQNNECNEGMASSIRLGVSALPNSPRGLFIMLADQPFIKDKVLSEMIKTFMSQYASGIRIVRPSYGGTLGHPVLFDQTLFKDLTKLEGDTGARSIIQSNIDKVAFVEFPNKDWNMDIDSPIDLEKAKKLLNNL